ncbi:MAG TPA: AI-2E family transporter [candidate division Zixibacteria bacterium]|nr:AI-2E family transporter [candidate division Zixibacteria bacterium]
MKEDPATVDSQESPPRSSNPVAISPRWRASTKRIVVVILLVLSFLAVFRIRSFLIPIILSIVIAYIILPAVAFLRKRAGLSNNLAIAIVYLLIIIILIAILAITIPQLIAQTNNLIANTPEYIQELGGYINEPLARLGLADALSNIPFGDISQDLGANLIEIIRAVGPQGFSLFGSLATRTLSTLGWLAIVVIVSFYIVKDHESFWHTIIQMTPSAYQADIGRLGREISGVWNAFLRGQLILGFVIFLVTLFTALIIGLPNALTLALIAGVLEFIPNIGPILAAFPALLVALFQSDASWLGSIVGPFWYAVIVIALYALIQRVENAVLVPRIIGKSLNLHPLIVFVGALIGASVAGVFGILLAAPLLASAKLVLLYLYKKLLDLPPFEQGGFSSD